MYSILSNHHNQIENYIDYLNILNQGNNFSLDELENKLNELQESNIYSNKDKKNEIKLNKPIIEEKTTFSSSCLNVINCMLDFMRYDSMINNFTNEVFSYIFALYDYYIYAGLNMFIAQPVLEHLLLDSVFINNSHYEQIEILNEEANYFLKYLNLRRFLIDTKKKIGEKIFLKVNINFQTLLPQLSSDIYIDIGNAYSCLIEKIIFYESCITLYKVIKRLIPKDIQNKFTLQLKFYKTILVELKSFIYYPIMPNIFGLNPYLNSLSIQNWNISEMEVSTKFSDASEFIYNIIDEIFEKYNNLTILSSDSLTNNSKLRFFNIILEFLIDELSTSINEIEECSSVGRSILLKDIKYLKSNFEDIIKEKKIINSDIVFNKIISYINAWYYNENDLFSYMKRNHIKMRLISSILKTGLVLSKLPNEIKHLIRNKLKEAAIEEINNINCELNK